MNGIVIEQLKKTQLDRLAAQKQLYSDAKRIQALQIVLSLPIVILLSFTVVFYPEFKVYSALWGYFITIIDICVFDPWQKGLKGKAANIQEIFDCDVLQLNWCDLKAGNKVEPETIIGASARYRKKDPDYEKIKDWYPTIVEKLPLHLARMVCQRANCWWDASLRRRYAAVVIIIVIITSILVMIFGLIGGLTFEKFLLAVLFPLMPAFILAIRQFRENHATANTLDKLRTHCEKLWEKAITGKIDSEYLQIESRILQDEIYENRRKCPLIFDWIYNKLRNQYEEQMNKGAEMLVEEALEKLKN